MPVPLPMIMSTGCKRRRGVEGGKTPAVALLMKKFPVSSRDRTAPVRGIVPITARVADPSGVRSADGGQCPSRTRPAAKTRFISNMRFNIRVWVGWWLLAVVTGW